MTQRSPPEPIPTTWTSNRFPWTSTDAWSQRTPYGTTRSPRSSARAFNVSGKRPPISPRGTYGLPWSTLTVTFSGSWSPVSEKMRSASIKFVTKDDQSANAAQTPFSQKDAMSDFLPAPVTTPSLSIVCPSFSQRPPLLRPYLSFGSWTPPQCGQAMTACLPASFVSAISGYDSSVKSGSNHSEQCLHCQYQRRLSPRLYKLRIPSAGGASCRVSGIHFGFSTSQPGVDSATVMPNRLKDVARLRARSNGEPSPSMSFGIRS